MTTIQEMDEFFDFDEAAHTANFEPLTSESHDISSTFTEIPDDAFTSLYQFGNTTPEEQLSLDLHNAMHDTSMKGLGPDDFSDFPRWIEGMDVPSRPCQHCQGIRAHCKIIREGPDAKGSCTSCVALKRSCSLVDVETLPVNNTSQPYWMYIPSSEGMSDALEIDDLGVPEELSRPNSWARNHSSTEDLMTLSRKVSGPDLTAVNSSTENLHAGGMNPKVGARFSRESVRLLRAWLSSHHRHPYPTDEEKEGLIRQTGLNKTQIVGWLANARRRGKVRVPRSVSPGPQQYSNAMEIPKRAGTPGIRDLNPLERWKNSPPENEPASITAITKAVSSSTYSSGRESPYLYSHTDDGSAQSLFNASSASSFGTSHSSGGSLASAFSHKSRGSFGSLGSVPGRGRRRRRQAAKPTKIKNVLTGPPKTFQCTFCTESFKTKHDWQRHEKSLHLSLERWICSPHGHSQFKADCNSPACVYCGDQNPTNGHAEEHYHSSCAERTLEERTFYRKDHLRQHLNLVHNAKFQAWSMESWKVPTPEIRSRCGFCGDNLESWNIRVNHLAEHFKLGKTMAQWKGDWGFEDHIVNVVENAMPPYLIHDEQNTMRPFRSTPDANHVPGTLEDKVKLSLVDYINDQLCSGIVGLTDDDLLRRAQITIRKDEALLESPPEPSWFRDLIMNSVGNSRADPQHAIQRNDADDAEMASLTWAEKTEKVNTLMDLNSISCLKERALKQYCTSRQALGLTPIDGELQVQACKILDDEELATNFKCKGAVQWFKYLITSSPVWLADFRRRAVLPRSSDLLDEVIRSQDDKSIDYSIHNYHRLERELINFVNQEREAGRAPTDADLQRSARIIIYGEDDSWNQTAADDPAFLEVFKRQHGLARIDENEPLELPAPSILGALGLSLLSSAGGSQATAVASPQALHWDFENIESGFPSPVSISDRQNNSPTLTTQSKSPDTNQPSSTSQAPSNSKSITPLRYFLNDANCYQRLVRELTRYVKACMSPNNPAFHHPTDAELQNQALWVIYDDDDPWNQTAANNAEWLARFKRDVGLLPSDSGPGLPCTVSSWQVSNGGSGFSPPYIHPNPEAKLPEYEEDVTVTIKGKTYNVKPELAGHYMNSLSGRYRKPAVIFCSRDLEDALGAFIKSAQSKGLTPTDSQLRTKAREILGTETTPADVQELLEKFKALHGLPPTITSGLNYPSNYTDHVDDSLQADFDMELGNMDFSSDFSTANLGNDFSNSDSQNLSLMEGISNPPVLTGIMDEMEETIGIEGLGTMDHMGKIAPIADFGYADAHRVMGATASPLRRRASLKLAQGSGVINYDTHKSKLEMLRSAFGH